MIGVYVRPWNFEFYTKLAKQTFPDKEIILFSEFKGCGNEWLGKGLYGKINYKQLFSINEMMEIYLRCRFLRSLSIEKAFELITKMSIYVESLLNSNNINLFIGHLIDNYTLDIIERICSRCGIEYISLVGHFFQGYCRISSRGELRGFRDDITDEEVNNVLASVIQSEYKPNFDNNKEKTKREGIQNFYRSKIRGYYYSIRKYIEKDNMNYHYNTQKFKNKSIKIITINKKKNPFKMIKEININSQSVYLPLHYTPESTIDYWCDDPKHALYEDYILDFITNSSKNVQFIIKEHPAMYMKRDIEFYYKLKSNINVEVIHPYENSNYLLEYIDNVFVHTGSVGIEALLRGKKVFAATQNYYCQIHPNCIIKNYLIDKELIKKPLIYDNHQFIRDLLRGLIPAEFINSKSIMKSDVNILSKYLKLYIDSLKRKHEIKY